MECKYFKCYQFTQEVEGKVHHLPRKICTVACFVGSNGMSKCVPTAKAIQQYFCCGKMLTHLAVYFVNDWSTWHQPKEY